jgi:hypothetical protein
MFRSPLPARAGRGDGRGERGAMSPIRDQILCDRSPADTAIDPGSAAVRTAVHSEGVLEPGNARLASGTPGPSALEPTLATPRSPLSLALSPLSRREGTGNAISVHPHEAHRVRSGRLPTPFCAAVSLPSSDRRGVVQQPRTGRPRDTRQIPRRCSTTNVPGRFSPPAWRRTTGASSTRSVPNLTAVRLAFQV